MDLKLFFLVLLAITSLYFVQGSSDNDKLFSSYLEVTSQTKSLGMYPANSNNKNNRI